MKNFHPEKGLEENMISKFKNAQCCLLLQQTLYQFRMCTKLIVWYLIMGYKLPEHYNT